MNAGQYTQAHAEGQTGVRGCENIECRREATAVGVFFTNSELAQQALGLLRTLGGGQFQPVAGLLRLVAARLAVEPAELQLRSPIAGARGLAQQFQADTPVAGIAAIAAQQLPQATLRQHHALACRLLEQANGETLHARRVAQTRTVQQPECDTQGQAHGRGFSG